jgi:hypothetical protein
MDGLQMGQLFSEFIKTRLDWQFIKKKSAPNRALPNTEAGHFESNSTIAISSIFYLIWQYLFLALIALSMHILSVGC